MITYCWYCENCDHKFEFKSLMSECNIKPKCPQCKRTRAVSRDYGAENVSFSPPIKTIGSLAEKNADKFSSDKKEFLKDKNDSRKQ